MVRWLGLGYVFNTKSKEKKCVNYPYKSNLIKLSSGIPQSSAFECLDDQF